MSKPREQRHLLSRQAWESGWAEHDAAQLRRLAALSFAEKVQWLEEAQTMVDHLSRQNLRRIDDKRRS